MSRRWVVFAFATVFFSLLPAVPASAGPTYVTSHIYTNTTWTRTGSPYIVDIATLWVQPGVTLTIDPGVKVVMNQWLGVLDVKGNLQAIGTRRRPILFTSGQDHFSGGTGGARGQWQSISFSDAGTGTLAFVEIRYGGFVRSDFAPYAYGPLSMESSLGVLVDHAWIHANNNSGIRATGSAPVHVSGSIIHDNDIGVSITGVSGGSALIEHSSLSYNQVYGLFTNHAGTPLVQSVIHHSDISYNIRTGVQLQEVGSTPTSKYPTGHDNNIYDNGGVGEGLDEIGVLYDRTDPSEALWEPNYWGPNVSMAPACVWAPTTWHFHLVDMSDLWYPQRGPIPSNVWSHPTESAIKCRTDRLKVWEWSVDPIPNLVPAVPPW